MLPITSWRPQPTMGGGSQGDAPFPFPESQLLLGARLNLMLAGSQSAVEAAIVALTPHLRQPVTTWREGMVLHLPPEPAGTLVLREVGRLNCDQQRQLAGWLDMAAGSTQIVSTTSDPLPAFVERRSFLDLLYYRLNVVRLEVTNDCGDA